METAEKDSQKDENPYAKSHGRGKLIGGAIIVAAGVLLLIKELGVDMPHWVFSWQMFLIVFGIYIGFKHSFRHPGWFIMTAVGSVFLCSEIYPDLVISSLIWPILIIIFGILIMFKPKRKRCIDERHWKRWEHKWKDKWEWERENALSATDGSDVIETVSIFAGVKKHIISKDFKGGEIVCVFGGAEVNLTQADINGKAVMELTQVFGGTKLIVPAHWDVQHHDLVAVMGGIDDKRVIQKEVISGGDKVLVLRGTCFFGGIEIRSY